MIKKYTYEYQDFHISLFYVNENPLGYNKIIESLCVQEYDPFMSKQYLEMLLKDSRDQKIILPDDQNFIVALNEKQLLEKQVFECGTILYYLPFILKFSNGEREISETFFSESGIVDNFYTCYIVALKFKK